jgi:mono/diheme cytochrome c family protein
VGAADVHNPEFGGSWYWVRSPEQEARVVAGLYNRYCIRCHGVDGRGVWDIPDVPDFTNPAWQTSRPDAYLTRVVLEGRGAVMPPFRGTLTLEEACAMARYLRRFVPGTEVSRPDLGAATPAPPPPAAPEVMHPPAPAPPNTTGPFSR